MPGTSLSLAFESFGSYHQHNNQIIEPVTLGPGMICLRNRISLVASLMLFALILFPRPACSYNKADYEKLITTKSCRNCYLYGAPLSKINLTGADLRGADLTRAKFKKATLYKARLPDPSNYRHADFTGAMWPDGQICREGSLGRCVLGDD